MRRILPKRQRPDSKGSNGISDPQNTECLVHSLVFQKNLIIGINKYLL